MKVTSRCAATLSPVAVQVQHRESVAKRGGQAFAFEDEVFYQDLARIPAFPQEHHRATVVRPGGSRHHCQLVLLDQTRPCVQ